MSRTSTHHHAGRFVLGLAMIISCAQPVSAGVVFPLIWRWSNPTPHGANLFGLANSSGFTIQVGERGQIFTSQDGLSWVPRDSHTTAALRAATFFGGRILISGESGTLLFADDPAAFYAATVTTTDWLEGVAASPFVAVAVGDNAAIYTSPNGINWQRQVAPAGTPWLRAVAYGAGVFTAVGDRGFIATSPNGTNWTVRLSGSTNSLGSVTWTGDHFLAAGDGGKTLVSLSGSTWNPLTSGATNNLYASAGGPLSQLVAGDSELWAQDGLTWSNQLASTAPAPLWTYYSGLSSGSVYMVGGRSGMYLTGSRTNSSAPLLWSTQADPVRSWLWSVRWLGGMYVAVGDHGTIITSDNGIEWPVSIVPAGATNSVLLGVGGSTNLLVAAGNGGTLYISPNTFADIVTTNSSGTVSTNRGSTMGLVWNQIAQTLTTNDLQGCAFFGNRYFVCGGGGTILSSSDGTNWVKASSPTARFLSGLEAHPNGLAACGDGGVILTTLNGTTWALQPTGTTNWISQVRYLNGRFIAVGENGTILTSSNGTNWLQRASGTSSWLNDVEFVSDNYFVVGNQGSVLVSTNAANWMSVGTITRKSLYGVAQQGGQVLAVGVEGAIVRSQAVPAQAQVNISSYSRTLDANLFLFVGQPDQRFNLDRSLVFTNWISTLSPLEILDGSGTLLYLETIPTNPPPRQFYRTMLTH